MKAADLDRAQKLVAQIAAADAMHARLAKGEALSLVLGSTAGPSLTVIEVTPGYVRDLRAELQRSFAEQASDLRAQLAALGVEA